jgi:hypothetical protein
MRNCYEALRCDAGHAAHPSLFGRGPGDPFLGTWNIASGDLATFKHDARERRPNSAYCHEVFALRGTGHT